MKALGIPELLAHLRGEHRRSMRRSPLAQRATRRYAKRQITWFRHQMTPDLVFTEQFSESLLRCSRHFIDQFLLTRPDIADYGAAPRAGPGADRRAGFAVIPVKEQVMSAEPICGADIVIKALVDQGVDVVFGYPGGAVLPIYDSLFKQNALRHILVRQEGGAVHAAEGYARSTGKVGVVLVTSGPGATNAVTGLTDALMDSVPVVCLTGQVPTHLIGNDAFQEADTTGITRPCTKHNYLVKDVPTWRGCCTRRSMSRRAAVPGRSSSTCRRTCCSPWPRTPRRAGA